MKSDSEENAPQGLEEKLAPAVISAYTGAAAKFHHLEKRRGFKRVNDSICLVDCMDQIEEWQLIQKSKNKADSVYKLVGKQMRMPIDED